MAKQRLSMRKIKDILRLRYEAKLSYRGIAQALDIGYGTVVDYLKRADQARLQWPLPTHLDERDLGRLLFPTQARTGGLGVRPCISHLSEAWGSDLAFHISGAFDH